LHSPCPDCIKKSEKVETSAHGKQLTLQETT
jgi:hypothetical protein